MIAYLILAAITVLMVLLTVRIVRRTGQWTFVVGIGVIYLWTFFGAWFFIGDALSGYQGFNIGMNYYYLMEKMFPFELDGCYSEALMRYGVFALVMMVAVLFIAPNRPIARVHGHALRVDHRAFFVLALIGSICSYLIVRPSVLEAIEAQESIYQYTRHADIAGSSIHSLCNLLVCFSLLLGWAIKLTRSPAHHFASNDQRWSLWAYPIVLVAFAIYLMVLGNRHELFMALILGSALFFVNGGKLRSMSFGIYMLVPALSVVFTAQVRDHTWQEISTLVMEPKVIHPPFSVDVIKHVPRDPQGPLVGIGQRFFTNEMFAAHFSMYGVCRFNVEPDPFISAKYIIASVVPKILDKDRPASAYEHYAEYAHLTPGQGYTINHATGWYINGGLIMMMIGGLFLGGVWGFLMRLNAGSVRGGAIIRILSIMGTSCLVAFMPALIREGPEVYKAVIIEGFALPIGIIWLAHLLASRSTKTDVPA